MTQTQRDPQAARQRLYVLVVLIFCAATFLSPAQTTAQALAHGTMVGSWLVTLQGDAETRTLVVSEEAPTNDGALLTAKFGWTDRGQAPVTPRVVRVNDQRQLLLTTPGGAQIAANEQPDGSFKGTFTKRNGGVVEVTIARVPDDPRRQPAQSGASIATQTPGSDVPASCAGFFGGWAGSWGLTDVYQYQLWVREIKADCTARVSYGDVASNKGVQVNPFFLAKIEDGTLALRCSRGGNPCLFFNLHGDEIWASYTLPPPFGGTVSTVFRKIK